MSINVSLTMKNYHLYEEKETKNYATSKFIDDSFHG
jgi:hypothetical protein